MIEGCSMERMYGYLGYVSWIMLARSKLRMIGY